MAKKTSKTPDETRRFSALIRVTQSVADDARTVASLQGVTMAEYVSSILEPILKRELIAALKKRVESSEDES